jgi:hypothetical protein
MRFLWTYLIVVIVFAFGFVSASMFTVGMPPLRRALRGAEPDE